MVYDLGKMTHSRTRNHWTLWLITHPSEYSLRLDVPLLNTEEFSLDATLTFKTMDYREKDSILAWHVFEAAPGSTVADFANLIYSNKRHLYRYNPSGFGCRFWM